MVAAEHDGRSVLGVILIPALDECVYAAEGQGAFYTCQGSSPRPARVSSRARLSEGLFLTSEVANFRTAQERAVYDRLESVARLSRSWGDCYGYLMVATGRAELMVDPIMNVWDAAAVQPILEQSGGTFTDWQGRRTIYSGQGVATNGLILDEVLAILGADAAGSD
jgi:fructose-1,6-bisphosphatase/inositol monophosphatase family enzyme